jgi:transmembrane sensor
MKDSEKPDFDWDRVTAYISDNMEVAEREDFEKWLDASDEHRARFEKAKKIWELSDVKTFANVNTEGAWNKVNARAQITKPAPTLYIFKNTAKYISRIAAIAVLGLISWYFISKFNNEKQLNSENSLVSALLPDGSKIDLNKNTNLRYPETFKSNIREVYLDGEAFFKIARNEKKPFIVHTLMADITVLGTSFNVLTNSKGNVEVIVESGVVSVQTKNEEKAIVLHKNERAEFDFGTKKLLKTENTDMNYLSWKTRKFKFSEAPLSSVFSKIEAVYDCKFEFADSSILKYKLTANYDSLELNIITKLVSETFGIKLSSKYDSHEPSK